MFIRDLEQIQHVIDNVYIGNSKHSEEELISLGITHVFNISNNQCSQKCLYGRVYKNQTSKQYT